MEKKNYSLKDVHFIMATVPWRKQNALQTLNRAIAAGVGKISLILDGYEPDAIGDFLPPLTAAAANHNIVFCSGVIRGYGERWYEAARSDKPIVMIVDDDLIVMPEYWEHSLNEFLRLDCAVMSLGGWCGSGEDQEKYHYHDIGHSVEQDWELNTTQNNAITLWSSVARGMCESDIKKLLPTFYARPGEDEGPISCYCWLNKLKMMRPKGGHPICYQPALSQDERSLYVSGGHKVILPLRQLLSNHYGWTWKCTMKDRAN